MGIIVLFNGKMRVSVACVLSGACASGQLAVGS